MVDQESVIWAFLRLARPHFLAGGFLLYGVGAAIARYEGHTLHSLHYGIGQWFVTSVQLMTHFVNEYWDVATDRANTNRTWFSGGSGVIAAGELDRRVARLAARVCLCSALAAAAAIVFGLRPDPAAWIVMALALGGAWFYSSPPLALSSTGYGEPIASLIVAFLLPAFAHLIQTGTITAPVIWAAAPLVALHFAMVLAFAMPDIAADEAVGKRTLAVRLGRRGAAWAHHAAIVAGVALLVGTFGPKPSRPADAVALSLPVILLAATQMWQMARLAQTERGPFGWLTLNAVSSFFVAAALMTYRFWADA